jgi:hypothetical protein
VSRIRAGLLAVAVVCGLGTVPARALPVDPSPVLVVRGSGPATATFTLAAPVRLDLHGASIAAAGTYGGVFFRSGRRDYGGVLWVDALDPTPTSAASGYWERYGSARPQPTLPAGTYTAYLLGDAATAVTIPLLSGPSLDVSATGPSRQVLRTAHASVAPSAAATTTPVGLTFAQPRSMAVFVFGSYSARYESGLSTSLCLARPGSARCRVAGRTTGPAMTGGGVADGTELAPGAIAGTWDLRYAVTTQTSAGGDLALAVLQLEY